MKTRAVLVATLSPVLYMLHHQAQVAFILSNCVKDPDAARELADLASLFTMEARKMESLNTVAWALSSGSPITFSRRLKDAEHKAIEAHAVEIGKAAMKRYLGSQENSGGDWIEEWASHCGWFIPDPPSKS